MLKARDIHHALQQSVHRNFGEFGMGSIISSLQARCLEPRTGIFVLRTNRDTVRKVHVALTLITTVSGVEASFRVLRIAGSTRTCRPKAIRILETALDKLPDTLEEEERLAIISAFGRDFEAFQG